MAGSVQVGIEPGDGAADAVALVLGLHEVVAFVFVDDELGFDANSFEGVRAALQVWKASCCGGGSRVEFAQPDLWR